MVATRPAPAHIADVRPVGRNDGHLPGTSPWLFAKLYSQADRQTEILAELAGLLSGWDSPAEWWYVPYRDPDPHLRVRVRLPSGDDYGPATQRLGAWTTRLRQHGLLGRMLLDTYYPETGRYGFDAAMAAAEQVFAADSAAALAQRQMAAHDAIAPEAITVASLVDLTVAFVGDIPTGMRWLIDQLLREPAPVDHALHATATRLADPRDDWAALRAADGGEGVIAVWQLRRAALADYRRLLASQRDPLSVLPSLLHMHHTRVFGIDPDRERIGRRLARASAKRWIATTRGATP
jgi:thiopeptide-type bacteriocin biosynthesis protein